MASPAFAPGRRRKHVPVFGIVAHLGDHRFVTADPGFREVFPEGSLPRVHKLLGPTEVIQQSPSGLDQYRFGPARTK